MKDHKKPWAWMDSLDKRPKQKKMDMKFGTWNVRSMYTRSDSKVRELATAFLLWQQWAETSV
jgi:hypothetical protein